MILAPHMIVGAVIGAKVHNFWLVAILSTISHFILDKMPHFDYLTNQEITNFRKGKKFKIILKTLIDVIVGLILLFVLVCNRQLTSAQLILVIVGVFFSVLPDFIWGLSMIFDSKILNKYRNFKARINYQVKTEKEGKITFLGTFTQILVIIVALLVFFS
jgi:hypothetical protein